MENIQAEKPINNTAIPEPSTDDNFNPDIRQFFENGLSDIDPDNFEIVLYRVSRGTRGKVKKTFLKRFFDIPMEEEIGDQFGSGDYFVITTHPITGKVLSRFIYLDKIFDKEPPPGSAAAPAGNDIATIKEIINLVAPIIQARPQTDPLMLMEKMSSIMVGGMKKMNDALIEKNVNSIRPEIIQNTPGEYAGIVKDVIEIIKNWGGKFLESKGFKEKAYKSIILDSDEMQAAKENQLLASAIYSAGCLDPEIGQEKITNLMRKLDFDIEPGNSDSDTTI